MNSPDFRAFGPDRHTSVLALAGLNRVIALNPRQCMQTHGPHLIFAAAPAWGHLRPLTHLATKTILHQAQGAPPIIITLLTVGDYGDRIKKEVAQAFEGQSPESRKKLDRQIRVISIGGEGTGMMVLFPVLFSEFPAYYDLLVNEQPVTCMRTGIVYESLPKPKTAVVDMLAYPVAQAILASKSPLPIVASAPMAATIMFRMIAPGQLGGLGELPSWVAAEISSGNKSKEEAGAAAIEEWVPNKGNVIRIPGMLPFYDYESAPQEPSLQTWDLISGAWEILSTADGILLDSTAAYEPVTIPAVRVILEKLGKKLYPVGPLIPPASVSMCKQNGVNSSTPEDQDEVATFLDAAEKQHGSHSVLYISFGTLFWPRNSEYFRAWLEALLDLKIPFICSTASQRCNMTEDLRAQITNSGLGLLTPWAPQESILTHSATGWFMSHCGHNSIMEAMSAGVPIIAWPIEADQPIGAAYISLSLKAGFELVQVRTGVRGLRPLYRGRDSESFVQPQGKLEAVREEALDILRRAWGEEGQTKRENAQTVKRNFQSSWAPGGDAQKNMTAFLEEFAAA